MPIDPEKLLEITKKSQVEYFKNEIPISNDGKKRYTCANPEGPVDNNGCPSDDPYCNCPEEIKTLQPKDAFLVETNQAVTNEDFPRRNVTFNVINSDGEDLDEFESRQDALDFIEELDPAPEPTDEELEELLQKSKYCKLIEEGGTGSEEPLGEEYLGCDWQDPDSNFSCICPEVGSKYKDWKKYYETYSTFWNTPKQTPLLRNAQMTLLTAQKAKAIVHGDFSIRPGAIINLEISNINNDNSLKSSSGKWMVAEIEHSIFGANAHTMTLTLIRDSLYVDANSSQSVES